MYICCSCYSVMLLHVSCILSNILLILADSLSSIVFRADIYGRSNIYQFQQKNFWFNTKRNRGKHHIHIVSIPQRLTPAGNNEREQTNKNESALLINSNNNNNNNNKMKYNISNFLLHIILIKTDHEFCWRQIVILLIPFEFDEGERLWQSLNDLAHAYKYGI